VSWECEAWDSIWAKFGPWDDHQSLGRNESGDAQLTLNLLVDLVDCDDGGGITLLAVSWPDRSHHNIMVDGRHDEALCSICVFFVDYHSTRYI